MTEERRMILEMLRDGAIDVDEAERLLAAIPDNEKTDKGMVRYDGAGRAVDPKRIRVRVDEGGKTKLNLRVPFSLVRAGLKIAQVVGPKYSVEAKALEEIDIDEILDSLSTGEITLPYTIMDADDEEEGEHVEIVIE